MGLGVVRGCVLGIRVWEREFRHLENSDGPRVVFWVVSRVVFRVVSRLAFRDSGFGSEAEERQWEP